MLSRQSSGLVPVPCQQQSGSGCCRSPIDLPHDTISIPNADSPTVDILVRRHPRGVRRPPAHVDCQMDDHARDVGRTPSPHCPCSSRARSRERRAAIVVRQLLIALMPRGASQRNEVRWNLLYNFHQRPLPTLALEMSRPTPQSSGSPPPEAMLARPSTVVRSTRPDLRSLTTRSASLKSSFLV